MAKKKGPEKLQALAVFTQRVRRLLILWDHPQSKLHQLLGHGL
jgi:hypothetical protein